MNESEREELEFRLKHALSRRQFLRGALLTAGAAGLVACAPAAPPAPTAKPAAPAPAATAAPAAPAAQPAAKGSGRIVVADPGGPQTEGYKVAYHSTFQQDTGVESVQVAREHEPVAQVKSMVETKNYIWNVVILPDASAVILGEQNLLENLDYDKLGIKKTDFMPAAILPYWIGSYAWCHILAYRTDKYGENGPKSWADFWNVQKFPGRRALYKSPTLGTLDAALVADGVPVDKLYPLDVDRAFKSLDKIKKDITVWWTGGAQSTQLLQSGEVDMIGTWNARAQAAIDTGTKAKIVWEGGVYALDGWSVPKGTPNLDGAMRWISYSADAKRSALWTEKLGYGPSNLQAYQYVRKERLPDLGTTPENLKNLAYMDVKYWVTNRDKLIERFNAWLLT